jgi:hypothetical protein
MEIIFFGFILCFIQYYYTCLLLIKFIYGMNIVQI